MKYAVRCKHNFSFVALPVFVKGRDGFFGSPWVCAYFSVYDSRHWNTDFPVMYGPTCKSRIDAEDHLMVRGISLQTPGSNWKCFGNEGE